MTVCKIFLLTKARVYDIIRLIFRTEDRLKMIRVKNIYFDRKYTPDYGEAVTPPQSVVGWPVTGVDGL